ncbi:MAG: hypothetical protein HUJ29_12675 [Gammaproteobacteria bacterium]|nr:hypothetical protein [Gammaproteobacteria bacterium]
MTGISPDRSILATSLRLLGAMGLMFLALVAGSLVMGDAGQSFTPEEEALSSRVAVVIAVINALVLSYLALRSRWHGWKLVGALFLVQFGLETLMTQIETLAFRQAMGLTPEQIAPLFLGGFLRALIFAPLAVVILGKTQRVALFARDNTRLRFSLGGWVKRLTYLAVAYVMVYFLFGYFIAWQSPELRQFYAESTDLKPFLSHMMHIIGDEPGLLLLQFVRGYLWVIIVLPIIRMHKGGTLETGLAISVTMAVLVSGSLLFPNPYMPEPVRMIHFTELWTSMAVFGVLTAWIMMFRPGRPSL